MHPCPQPARPRLPVGQTPGQLARAESGGRDSGARVPWSSLRRSIYRSKSSRCRPAARPRPARSRSAARTLGTPLSHFVQAAARSLRACSLERKRRELHPAHIASTGCGRFPQPVLPSNRQSREPQEGRRHGATTHDGVGGWQLRRRSSPGGQDGGRRSFGPAVGGVDDTAPGEWKSEEAPEACSRRSMLKRYQSCFTAHHLCTKNTSGGNEGDW